MLAEIIFFFLFLVRKKESNCIQLFVQGNQNQIFLYYMTEKAAIICISTKWNTEI